MYKNKQRIIKTFTNRAENYNSDGEWVTSKNTIEPLIPNIFGSKRFLDICSGTGTVGNFAYDRQWKVFALDITAEMLQRNTNDEIIKIIGESENLPFLDNYFDVVVLRQGLQYSNNINNVINECTRVCKNQIKLGHITVFDENDIPWWKDYFKIASPGRINIFKPNEIYNLCKKGNFAKITQTVNILTDSFISPIRYLDSSKKQEILLLLKKAPKNIIKNYQFLQLDNGDYSYLHRWEFITLSVNKKVI